MTQQSVVQTSVRLPGPPACAPPPSSPPTRGRRGKPPGAKPGRRPSHYPCPVEGCGRVLSSSTGRAVHVQWHTGEKPWLCTFDSCDRRFYVRKHREQHLRTHTGEKPLLCPIEGCPARFLCSSNRKAHMQTHDVPKPWLCPVAGCTRGFVTNGRMRMHLRRHGQTGRLPAGSEAESDKRQGGDALAGFVLYTRRIARPWLCPVEGCNKSYSRKDSLTAHQYEHRADKPFSCPFEGCPKWFPTSIRLDVHLRVHTGQRPYVCPVERCGKRFTKSNSLSGHMKTHKDDESFFCPVSGCRRRFPLLADRQRHLATHQELLPAGSPCLSAAHENRTTARTRPDLPALAQPVEGTDTEDFLASCPGGSRVLTADARPVDQPWRASPDNLASAPAWGALPWSEDPHPGPSVPAHPPFDNREAGIMEPLRILPSPPRATTPFLAQPPGACAPAMLAQSLDPFGWLSLSLPTPALAPAGPDKPCPASPERAPSPVQHLMPHRDHKADTDFHSLGDLYTFPTPACPADKG